MDDDVVVVGEEFVFDGGVICWVGVFFDVVVGGVDVEEGGVDVDVVSVGVKEGDLFFEVLWEVEVVGVYVCDEFVVGGGEGVVECVDDVGVGVVDDVEMGFVCGEGVE